MSELTQKRAALAAAEEHYQALQRRVTSLHAQIAELREGKEPRKAGADVHFVYDSVTVRDIRSGSDVRLFKGNIIIPPSVSYERIAKEFPDLRIAVVDPSRIEELKRQGAC